jgi:hypothetical protein
MKQLRICMYGAASDGVGQNYVEAVEALGREIATHHHKLIYGGGASGLMGAVARGARSCGGDVIGVVPNFMSGFEPIFPDCTEIITTETMGERKQIMEDNADAFVIVPGGIGTFDEFFQVLTLAELERLHAPIVLLNVDGFYDNLIGVIDDGIEKGFVRPKARTLFSVCENSVQAIESIEAAILQPVGKK